MKTHSFKKNVFIEGLTHVRLCTKPARYISKSQGALKADQFLYWFWTQNTRHLESCELLRLQLPQPSSQIADILPLKTLKSSDIVKLVLRCLWYWDTHTHIYSFFRFFSIIGHYRILMNIVPCGKI